MAIESKKGSYPLDGLRYGRQGERISHLRRALQGTQCPKRERQISLKGGGRCIQGRGAESRGMC